MTPKFAAIILAAGKGTRMKSALPKVLHEIAGRPMLGHAMAAAVEAGASEVLLVTAPNQHAVRDYADEQGIKTTHAIQQEQLGTGDAVRTAFEATEKHDYFVVMFGDTPLMCWVTTSDVSQGDELLGVYGHDYWVARALGAVPAYTPPVLQAAREWKQAIQASRRGVQTAYAEEIDALGGLFDHADADARQMARGEQAPRARPRCQRRKARPPLRPLARPLALGQNAA